MMLKLLQRKIYKLNHTFIFCKFQVEKINKTMPICRWLFAAPFNIAPMFLLVSLKFTKCCCFLSLIDKAGYLTRCRRLLQDSNRQWLYCDLYATRLQRQKAQVRWRYIRTSGVFIHTAPSCLFQLIYGMKAQAL